MRRLVLAVLFVLTTTAVTLTARLVPAADSPAQAEKAVLAAMETWRQAMLTKDAAAFDRVFHPDLRYGHSIGLIESKQQATDHVLKSTTVYKAVELSDTKVKLYGDTAIVTGKAHYEKHPKGAPVLHQHLVVLSVWVKTARGWQMLARQSTEPNPAPPAATAKQ
jgi:ketosteroid isomerase-like protein